MRALILGASLLACSRPVPVEVPEQTAANTHASLLALYDQAGFPAITGRRLVERRTDFDRGPPVCERGFIVVHRGAPVLMTFDLRLHHGPAFVDAIPAELRQTTEREFLYRRGVTKGRVVGGRTQTVRVVESDVSVAELAQPRLGLDVPRQPPCDTRGRRRDTDVPPAELELLVRAQWAQTRGLPELAGELLGKLDLDDPRLESRLRSQLAGVLVAEAHRAMFEWLPRDEVAHLLRRAAAIAPDNPRAALWLEDAHHLSTPVPRASDSDADALATLLVDQAMSPGSLPQVPFLDQDLTWDVDEHLRDPIADLLRLGMPGVRRLVDRLGDPTWTRASCGGAPCRLGVLVREGLGYFAMRSFETDAEVRAWWSTVEQMTEEEMLRAALEGPEFMDASWRLTRIVGPGILTELQARRSKQPREEIAAAISDAAREHATAIAADHALRRRYSRALRKLVGATRRGWSPDVVGAWLAVDPVPALDFLVERFGRALPRLSEEDLSPDEYAEFYWSEAFERGLEVEHPGMMRLLERTLALPRSHPLVYDAWDGLDYACGTDPEPDPQAEAEPLHCPRSVRRAAIRLLRRQLAAVRAPTRWPHGDAWRLAVLTGKPTTGFAREDPLREQFRHAQALLGRAAPPLPDGGDDSDLVIATRVHGRARTPDIERWLESRKDSRLRELPQMFDELVALAQAQRRTTWTLLVTRYAGRGIVLEVDAVEEVEDDDFIDLEYRDGTHWAGNGGSTAGEAVAHMFGGRQRFRWQTLDPPPISELELRFTTEE